jgi:MFS family permease
MLCCSWFSRRGSSTNLLYSPCDGPRHVESEIVLLLDKGGKSLLEFINRNLLLLFGCQMVFVSGNILLVTVGGIVGYQLAPDPAFATLPVALMVIGTASATVPAAFTMQRIGRKYGFILATGIAALGAWLATRALAAESFWLFCAATACVGSSLGFSQQFRFAAAESVPLHRVSHAVSFILLGSIAGAFLGPAVVSYSADANPGNPYSLAFQMVIALYFFAALLLLGLRDMQVVHEVDAAVAGDGPGGGLFSRPAFVTAVLAGVLGQGVMTYVMTATPISMNVDNGFSLQTTSEVVRAHVIAMYLPSLITPWLVSRLGLPRMMLLGVVTLGVTVTIGMGGHHLMHYWFCMVLLGVGWNFLFVAGTSMLVQTYRPQERFRAQAINDFSVFGASALASLLAGTVLFEFGWLTLMVSIIPALVVMLGTLAWLRRSQQPTAPA